MYYTRMSAMTQLCAPLPSHPVVLALLHHYHAAHRTPLIVHVGLQGVTEELKPIFSLGNLEPNFFVKHDSEPIWSAKRWQNLKQEIFSKKI